MPESGISSIDKHPRKHIRVLDSEISYIDAGGGDPIVFLHGNPTSSFLWRNIIPYLENSGRCLAPDLVGMGRSGKSPDRTYRFTDHVRYLDAWFDALNITKNVVLVVHDWGSALGFYRASRFPEQIEAIAYMEAIVQPLMWGDFPPGVDDLFRALRSQKGEEMILGHNFFVETILPKSVIRKLSEEEMETYRTPYKDRDARLPTLVWPRELPIEGEPEDVAAIVTHYSAWMVRSEVPKLLISAEPGAILTGRNLEFCRTWPNQHEISVSGIHYIQEDSPAEIGLAVRDFVDGVCGRQ